LRNVATIAGVRHAVATTSGIAALHLAAIVAGVEPTDEILMPAMSFIAPANAVRYLGALPVFLDCDPVYWQLDRNVLSDFLTLECSRIDGALRNRRTRRRIAAILPVHILGHPAPMPSIVDIAWKYELPVIEDAAESLGGSCRGRAVGSFGDVASCSFNGNKIVTAAGGGALLSNDDSVDRRARHLASQAKLPGADYVHDEVGFNYRLSGIQAAFGCAQLAWLQEHIVTKRRIARQYADALSGFPNLTLMVEPF
jgi:perosamine synthetase